MKSQIRSSLASSVDMSLVDQLLKAYEEAKQNFYLGRLRLNEVEGGRFCEAAFRILEHVTTGKFTPIGKPLKSTDELTARLAGLPFGSFPEAIRIHIPRALRVVYDIRNKRDAAHLGDGIDPNLQDAALVCSSLDWVLAEFVRLYHKSVKPHEVQSIVENLVTRKAPVVQDFGGFLKVLNPKLGAADFCLVLLYQRGSDGASFQELDEWVRPSMRNNLRRTLGDLTNKKSFVHFDGSKYKITGTGQKHVETKRLLGPL
jgi:hypothetical protein